MLAPTLDLGNDPLCLVNPCMAFNGRAFHRGSQVSKSVTEKGKRERMERSLGDDVCAAGAVIHTFNTYLFPVVCLAVF